MQANPPAAAAAAKPADIFKASRRLKLDMVLVPRFGRDHGALQFPEIQDRLPGLSTEMGETCRRLYDGQACHRHSDMT